MTRHDSDPGLSPCAGRYPFWFLGCFGALLLVLAGCTPPSQLRAKAAEEGEGVHYDIPTIGDRTAIGNAEPMQLGGVGLVEGLEGTGGDCTHDSYRTRLADELRKQGVQNIPELLKSPDCALVIVEAQIPPGTVPGDKLDVEVKLPPGSRATSLRGGVLHKCYLYNFDFTRNLRPDYSGPQGLLLGHKRAEAQGAILVTDGEGGGRQGRIWQGAICKAEQPLSLVMNPDSQQARFTALTMERINATFLGSGRGKRDSTIAHTSNNISVALRVPIQYRHNLPRYLRVVRAIPLMDSSDLPPKEGDDKRSYRQKLTDDLLEPSRTVIASIRLEALGDRSISALKLGLKSPHPLVRFSSAEALAYLGSPAGCEELGRAASKYPILRAYALSALASLNEAASVLQLQRMISSDLDDEARTGAFRALWLLNEREPMVRGQQLGSFWVHSIAPNNRPLIFISTQKRAEVVMFGKTPALKPPFSLLAGEFTVTASSDSAAAVISWVPRDGELVRKTCGLEVGEVIRSMAEMGAGFPDTLAMLQQASGCGSISCPVRIDNLPEPGSVYELMQLGKDPTGEELLLPAGGQRQPIAQTEDINHGLHR